MYMTNCVDVIGIHLKIINCTKLTNKMKRVGK